MGNCLKSGSSNDDVSLLPDGGGGGGSIGTSATEAISRRNDPTSATYQESSDPRMLSLGYNGGGSNSGGGFNALFGLGGVSTSGGGGVSSNYYSASTLLSYSGNTTMSHHVAQLAEEEQIKIAQRIGLIHHLPIGVYDGSKKNRECVICMIEFVVGEDIRFLPCMHTYHVKCIDDWLIRSFICPSCMEPVDAALLSTFHADS